jgi:hypothetical protein
MAAVVLRADLCSHLFVVAMKKVNLKRNQVGLHATHGNNNNNVHTGSSDSEAISVVTSG